MKALTPATKAAGLLVPVFALRHPRDLGIGDTLGVRDAIDFCAAQGLAILQILPVHETVGDHSPYNPISARALSPSLLALTPEEVPGLTEETLTALAPAGVRTELAHGPVQHGRVHALKREILRAAASCFLASASDSARAEFADFQAANRTWLPAYTLFRLLVEEYGENPNWAGWRPEHQTLAAAEAWSAAHPQAELLAQRRTGWAFIQWVAHRQWLAVRVHAEARGVWLMGEMSFGVSRSSVDSWAHPELFDLAWNMGTPPIAYFDTNADSARWGQNWGLPPYRWDAHRAEGFVWLRARLGAERQFFHLCRLDHLRGYFRGYMFPWDGGAQHAEFATLTQEEAAARTGGRLPRFVPGPDDDLVCVALNDQQGREIIRVLQEAAGDMGLIAEIMGQMPGYIRQAIDDLQVPSLTFPQLERRADRSLLGPEEYRTLSLAAYANHDHAPLAMLYANLRAQAQENPGGTAALDLWHLLHFAGWAGEPPAELTPELLRHLQRALLFTPCWLAVFLSSDLLGTAQRFNLPGSYGPDTWSERLPAPLTALAQDRVFGPRIAAVRELLISSGRAAAT